MSPVRGLLCVVALSVCLRSVPAAFICAQWEQLGTLSAASAMNFPALSGFSPSQFGMYRLSNAAGTNHLYIRDDSPAFFNANWPAASLKYIWISQTNNVTCSVDGRTFVGAPAGTLGGNADCNQLVSWMSARSPPAHLIGDHVCGTQNGWMLVHAGMTYDYTGGQHPCPMPGVTFTKLAACRDGVDVSTDSVVDLTVADLEVLLSRAGGPTLISLVAKIDTLETNWNASFVCETKVTSSAVKRWCSLRRM